jgi:hypothetical protein
MIERRYNPRRNTTKNILVVAKFMDLRSTGRLLNVSVGGGACIKLDGEFHVPVGTRFEICFAIPINSGNVYKLHFKSAIVIHITDGRIGLVTGNIERKLITDAA